MADKEYDRLYIQSLLAFNIVCKMEEKRVSVQELADACEVTTSSIKQLINCDQFVSARVLASICNCLKTTPSELFKERKNAEKSAVSI